MEDNESSFTDILRAHLKNSTPTPQQETVQPKSTSYGWLSFVWICVFLLNSLVLWIGWNHAMVHVFNFIEISFSQSMLIYACVKVVTRGFFSPQ